MPRGRSLSTEAVLEKAFELARADGIDSVTYNGLARALDIRPQSMYRYVPDIKALRVALLTGFLDELVDGLATKTVGLPDGEALRAFAVALYDACHAHKCYYETFDLMHRYGLVSELRGPLGRLVGMIAEPMSRLSYDAEAAARHTQLMMAAILGYAQMAMTTFIVDSLADNREAYVRGINELIDGIILRE